MANFQAAIRRLFVDTWGTIRWTDGQSFAVARFDQLPTCTETLEGVEGWVRGGTGVASVKHVCLKTGADTYAWGDHLTSDPSGNVTVAGTVQADGLRLDLTPTAESIVPTHTITVNINGTDYKIPIVAA